MQATSNCTRYDRRSGDRLVRDQEQEHEQDQDTVILIMILLLLLLSACGRRVVRGQSPPYGLFARLPLSSMPSICAAAIRSSSSDCR